MFIHKSSKESSLTLFAPSYEQKISDKLSEYIGTLVKPPKV